MIKYSLILILTLSVFSMCANKKSVQFEFPVAMTDDVKKVNQAYAEQGGQLVALAQIAHRIAQIFRHMNQWP